MTMSRTIRRGGQSSPSRASRDRKQCLSISTRIRKAIAVERAVHNDASEQDMRGTVASGRRPNDRPRVTPTRNTSAPRSAHGKVGGVGMLQGGMRRLTSAVRVRLPSACSAPLKRTQSGAPSAHPALESPLCARDATVRLDCSSSTNSIPETGFVVRSTLAARSALRSPIRTDGSSDGCSPDGLGI